MRAAGWGAEAEAATALLAARLNVLGERAEARAAMTDVVDECARRWFRESIEDAGNARADDAEPRPWRTRALAWNRWLRARARPGADDLALRLFEPESAELLRALGGQAAMDVCRSLATRE
jgi:hypothetical protein